MVNDEDVAKEMAFEKLCASGDCSSMPAKQKMQIKVCLIFRNNPESILRHNNTTQLLELKYEPWQIDPNNNQFLHFLG